MGLVHRPMVVDDGHKPPGSAHHTGAQEERRTSGQRRRTSGREQHTAHTMQPTARGRAPGTGRHTAPGWERHRAPMPAAHRGTGPGLEDHRRPAAHWRRRRPVVEARPATGSGWPRSEAQQATEAAAAWRAIAVAQEVVIPSQ